MLISTCQVLIAAHCLKIERFDLLPCQTSRVFIVIMPAKWVFYHGDSYTGQVMRFLPAFFCVSFSLFFVNVSHAGPGLQFVENKNQWDSSVDYGAKVPGGHMFVNASGFQYYFIDQEALQARHDQTHREISEATGEREWEGSVAAHYVMMEWTGVNPSTPQPFGKKKAYYNYFIGNDPSHHAARAQSYGGILYRCLYDDIDLKIYSSGRNLKYDFVVAPGADPMQIEGTYAGADNLTLDSNGNLYIRTSLGDLIEKRPYAYQIIGDRVVEVVCDYVLRNNRISFVFPYGYDDCETLIIDPLLIFSTYSGSTADNWGSTATPGEHGMLFSSGVTNHLNAGGTFPATPGAFQVEYGGLYDVAILKYDSLGQNLLYASYLGGSDNESPHSLVMDETTNDLLVLGTTSSDDFPHTRWAIDTTFQGGVAANETVIDYNNGSDIFIARISGSGDSLIAATYIGGTANDGLNVTHAGLTRNYGDELRGDIITDGEGNVYVSSVTASADLQLVNSFATAYNGGVSDALLLKLSPDLSKMIWGAFIGGSGTDAAYTLKFDKNGNILLAGGTTSTDFSGTSGSYQPAMAGDVDGWIARIASDGSSLLNATYTGTSTYDQIYFLDLNESGEIYVYGQTSGGDFPVTPGVYYNPNSGQFVQKFSGDLSTLIFSTVFGSGRGIPDISPTAFLVNECNNLYMTGWGGLVNSLTNHWQSNTVGMPLTADAYQSTTSGSDFYFMVLTDDATQFLYGTYLGGTFSRTHVDGGTSRFDKGGIVYHAVCSGCAAYNATENSTSDFPTTPDAWSRVNRSGNCNNAAFKFDLASLRARLQTNSVQLDMPGLKAVCIPDSIVFQNRCIGGELFSWDLGDGTKIVKPDTTMLVHQYQQPGRYLVKLAAIDPGTCKVTDSTATYIDVYIRAGRVQDNDELCEGSSYTLDASGGNLYHWISDDGTFQSSQQRPQVSPDTTTRYYVTVTEANGCVLRDSVDLRVVPGIEPEFEVSQAADCFERPVLLVRNTTGSASDAAMIFDFGDGTTSDFGEAAHRYEKDDLYEVRLTGVREFCTYESVVPIPVFSVKVPNVITPGSTPGYNDKFTIQFGEQEGVTPADYGVKVSLVVYNRWGTKVYESGDYHYDWSGEGLPMGVYYYEVTIGQQAVCKSWLEIM